MLAATLHVLSYLRWLACDTATPRATARNNGLWKSTWRNTLLLRYSDSQHRIASTTLEQVFTNSSPNLQQCSVDPQRVLVILQKVNKSNTVSRHHHTQRYEKSLRDINKKINELLESLSKLEVNATDEITPRTKQNLFKNDIKKILQFQGEIQDLRKYNDIATIPLKN
ncbi:uncharacterized protein LOC122569960 isoform X1 [Bombus pyrosoma]|uniref:uncharacterized protein LOC122569960 isoform X1 n=1 Tax=Bombus pyrosoma TaxID=396416 RepID=UPI001CB9D465|nr:uncharacterized protein LOC122569960 isoform X1 [Bombus pyrosoma]